MPLIITTDTTQEGMNFAEDFRFENRMNLINLRGVNNISEFAGILSEPDGYMIILDREGKIRENVSHLDFSNIGRVILLTEYKGGMEYSAEIDQQETLFIRTVERFEPEIVSKAYKEIRGSKEYRGFIESK